ncbi:uncharacterized protein LOC143889678 [Tasmannia lanceolata]|uniref:uncharacterized protein LOC143889678 n=1 Tax=Tasmannia lanceolata TaxID=3420 RepID=UPI004062CFA9
MSLLYSHHIILSNNPIRFNNNNKLLFYPKPISQKPYKPNLCSLRPPSPRPPQSPSFKPHNFPFKTLISFLFFSIFISLRLFFLSLLPPDFPQRWHYLIAFSADAESVAAAHLPSHLWQAVVASEDRRFFQHCGIDPVGLSRAVLSLSAGGGGSTITQQLVKNVFLNSERKFSRKVVEMVLALMLERKLSKWKILCSYLSMIYWGHGVYGIEAASAFYFGKQPSLLSLAESALLAGIIPSPERLSPLREPSRGRISQIRALRRMVKAGFLDIETALVVMDQPLRLRVDGPEHANLSMRSLYSWKDCVTLNRKVLSVVPWQ